MAVHFHNFVRDLAGSRVHLRLIIEWQSFGGRVMGLARHSPVSATSGLTQ